MALTFFALDVSPYIETLQSAASGQIAYASVVRVIGREHGTGRLVCCYLSGHKPCVQVRAPQLWQEKLTGAPADCAEVQELAQKFCDELNEIALEIYYAPQSDEQFALLCPNVAALPMVERMTLWRKECGEVLIRIDVSLYTYAVSVLHAVHRTATYAPLVAQGTPIKVFYLDEAAAFLQDTGLRCCAWMCLPPAKYSERVLLARRCNDPCAIEVDAHCSSVHLVDEKQVANLPLRPPQFQVLLFDSWLASSRFGLILSYEGESQGRCDKFRRADYYCDDDVEAKKFVKLLSSERRMANLHWQRHKGRGSCVDAWMRYIHVAHADILMGCKVRSQFETMLATSVLDKRVASPLEFWARASRFPGFPSSCFGVRGSHADGRVIIDYELAEFGQHKGVRGAHTLLGAACAARRVCDRMAEGCVSLIARIMSDSRRSMRPMRFIVRNGMHDMSLLTVPSCPELAAAAAAEWQE
jgi:hypothetical protein